MILSLNCPAGCGMTLFVSEAVGNPPKNIIECAEDDCPRPWAATELLTEDDIDYHIVRIHDNDMNMRHPLIERVNGELLDCGTHAAVWWAIREYSITDGTYRCKFNGDELEWSVVE